jgi:hypothetical protein
MSETKQRKQRRPSEETVEKLFYDVFADMEVGEQAIALRVLAQTHRLAAREEARREKAESGTQTTLQLPESPANDVTKL